MTRDEAVAMSESGWWKDKSPREIVAFQLYEEKLCMDFGDFHAAVERALGRPVYTHEFGLNIAGLKAEFEGKRTPASMTEIIGQLKEIGKPVIIVES